MRSFNAQTHEIVSRGQSCLPRALRVTHRRSWATWSSQTAAGGARDVINGL